MDRPGAEDHYGVLGISPDGTADDVKRAFRRLARECHPDVAGATPDAAERFKRIRAAYEVLSDPTQRARYDRSRGRPRGNGRGFPHDGPPPGRGPFGFGGGPAGFDTNPFADAFGGAPGGAGRGPAGPGRDNDLDLDDLVNGFSVDDFGFGDRPRPRGRPAPTPRDVDASWDLDLATAIAGGTLGVDTPDGRVVVRIPPWTSSGAKLRLRGKGRDGGDLVGTVRVVLPADLDDEGRRLLETFADHVKGRS